jgi:hypothetical protein
MLIEVWALVGDVGEIIAITLNESVADTWRADGRRVEKLSNAIKVD